MRISKQRETHHNKRRKKNKTGGALDFFFFFPFQADRESLFSFIRVFFLSASPYGPVSIETKADKKENKKKRSFPLFCFVFPFLSPPCLINKTPHKKSNQRRERDRFLKKKWIEKTIPLESKGKKNLAQVSSYLWLFLAVPVPTTLLFFFNCKKKRSFLCVGNPTEK